MLFLNKQVRQDGYYSKFVLNSKEERKNATSTIFSPCLHTKRHSIIECTQHLDLRLKIVLSVNGDSYVSFTSTQQGRFDDWSIKNTISWSTQTFSRTSFIKTALRRNAFEKSPTTFELK